MAISTYKGRIKLASRKLRRKVRSRCHTSLLALALMSLGNSSQCFASPWIETGDEQVRHHLATLADAGFISSPTAAWPLMWSNLKADLDNLNPADLNEGQLWSYRFLRHELRKAMNLLVFSQSVHASDQITTIGNFATDSNESFESSLGIAYTGEKLAYQAQATYSRDPADGQTYRADGSNINYLIGNWVIGAGLIDRWWGPGWESSLILSSNARPTPSIYLQRNLTLPFETPLLNWLGAWQMTTFMGQLESDREYPNAKLWGMRVDIKPFNQFELGLSRTAQWGGKSRRNDLTTFVKLFLGKDNLDDIDADLTQDHTNEPGNQLAGLDWRWGYSYGATSGSVYGQWIGEDEAGGMPSRSIGMAGVELNRLLGETHARLSLEAHNTRVYFYDSEKAKEFGNVAYEHGIYHNGYRFHDRPIGASTDNDTESLTLRSQLYFRNGKSLNVSLGHHRINIDGTNAAEPGGSSFGDNEQNTYLAQVSYTAPLNDVLLLEISAFNFSNGIRYQVDNASTNVHTGGFVGIRASYW
jgi:hypothetical protein